MIPAGNLDIRFLFGLLMFVGVSLLIEAYDNDHGTSYLWWYIGIIWLGYALANNLKLGNGLAALTSATRK